MFFEISSAHLPVLGRRDATTCTRRIHVGPAPGAAPTVNHRVTCRVNTDLAVTWTNRHKLVMKTTGQLWQHCRAARHKHVLQRQTNHMNMYDTEIHIAGPPVTNMLQ